MLRQASTSLKRTLLAVALTLTVLASAAAGLSGFNAGPDAHADGFKPPTKKETNQELVSKFIWGVGYICYDEIDVN